MLHCSGHRHGGEKGYELEQLPALEPAPQAEVPRSPLAARGERGADFHPGVGRYPNLHVAFLAMPGSTERERLVVEGELIRQFNPPCNG